MFVKMTNCYVQSSSFQTSVYRFVELHIADAVGRGGGGWAWEFAFLTSFLVIQR